MTQDLLIRADENGFYDLEIDGDQFATVSGMESSILVSFFTDRRAPASSVPDASRRRGWVGDILTAESGRGLGSLIWLYEQARLNTNTALEVAQAAQDCLSWLVQDKIAKSVSATPASQTKRGVTIPVTITAPDGTVDTYNVLWRQTDGANLSRV